MAHARAHIVSWTVLLGVAAALALCGCVRIKQPEAPAAVLAPPPPPDPFDEGSTSFVVSGPRFTPGETAIVKVCVTPEGLISSTALIGSSGDKRFDDFAVVWARQVKLASRPQPAAAGEVCGPVRVEIRFSPSPGIFGGTDSGLG